MCSRNRRAAGYLMGDRVGRRAYAGLQNNGATPPHVIRSAVARASLGQGTRKTIRQGSHSKGRAHNAESPLGRNRRAQWPYAGLSVSYRSYALIPQTGDILRRRDRRLLVRMTTEHLMFRGGMS